MSAIDHYMIMKDKISPMLKEIELMNTELQKLEPYVDELKFKLQILTSSLPAHVQEMESIKHEVEKMENYLASLDGRLYNASYVYKFRKSIENTWQDEIQTLNIKLGNSQGDAVLLASFIAYCG